ncbi:MAG: DnaJ domain-containing protein [Cyanobacteria bacterium TGS_CYA1]|nr:DnaJ domain-containing protein [Cyanobacteria bacterium TGS_CYA1]
MKNLYKILRVAPSADMQVIFYAYRTLKEIYGPENLVTGNAAVYAEIIEAYSLLSDLEKKIAYDKDFADQIIDQNPDSFYQILQVDKKADSKIIRYAYRYLASLHHPENIESGDSEKFRILTEAWRVLSDEKKRAEYDKGLSH